MTYKYLIITITILASASNKAGTGVTLILWWIHNKLSDQSQVFGASMLGLIGECTYFGILHIIRVYFNWILKYWLCIKQAKKQYFVHAPMRRNFYILKCEQAHLIWYTVTNRIKLFLKRVWAQGLVGWRKAGCVTNLLHVVHLSHFKVLIQHGHVGLDLEKCCSISSLIKRDKHRYTQTLQ